MQEHPSYLLDLLCSENSIKEIEKEVFLHTTANEIYKYQTEQILPKIE